jgi:hypothetical protein
MAARGRPKASLVLSDEERETLARWARRPRSPQSLAWEVYQRTVTWPTLSSDPFGFIHKWDLNDPTYGTWFLGAGAGGSDFPYVSSPGYWHNYNSRVIGLPNYSRGSDFQLRLYNNIGDNNLIWADNVMLRSL